MLYNGNGCGKSGFGYAELVNEVAKERVDLLPKGGE